MRKSQSEHAFRIMSRCFFLRCVGTLRGPSRVGATLPVWLPPSLPHDAALCLCTPLPPDRQPLTVLSPHSGLFVRSGRKHELSALQLFQKAATKTSFFFERIFDFGPNGFASTNNPDLMTPRVIGAFSFAASSLFNFWPHDMTSSVLFPAGRSRRMRSA